MKEYIKVMKDFLATTDKELKVHYAKRARIIWEYNYYIKVKTEKEANKWLNIKSSYADNMSIEDFAVFSEYGFSQF